MEHFVELVKALSWPGVVVWIGYFFRKEMRGLVGRLSSLKLKDLEASFKSELQKAESNAKAIQTHAPELKGEELLIKDQLFRIADVSPRAAIVEAWTLIETAAFKRGFHSGSAVQRVEPRRIVSFLEASGKFSPASLSLIEQLRRIRNQASHLPDFAISQAEAERYLDLAAQAAMVISAE